MGKDQLALDFPPEGRQAEIRAERMLKHVNSVALKPAVGRISYAERRLYNVLLRLAQDAGDREEHSAHLADVVRESEFNSNNTEQLKKSFKKLLGTVVEWQSPTNAETDVWEACTLLSGAKLSKDRKSGTVTLSWRYDTAVRAQLLAPERYAKLELESITNLRTHAGLALYEICARYVDNPGRRTARQPWRWWRPVLTGVALSRTQESQGEYRYFKRDVLLPAIAEVNNCTELNVVGPIEYKEGDNKTIAFIQFEVTKKVAATALPVPISNADLGPEDLQVIASAKALGVPQAVTEKLLRRFDQELLVEALNDLRTRLAMPADKIKPLANRGAWFKTIVEGKQAKAPPDKTAAAKGSIKPPQATIDRHKAALREEWLRRKKDELRKLFSEAPHHEQEEILSGFREQLASSRSKAPILRRLEASGHEHKMVRDAFASYLGERWHGDDWGRASADDLISLAIEKGSISTD